MFLKFEKSGNNNNLKMDFALNIDYNVIVVLNCRRFYLNSYYSWQIAFCNACRLSMANTFNVNI